MSYTIVFTCIHLLSFMTSQTQNLLMHARLHLKRNISYKMHDMPYNNVINTNNNGIMVQNFIAQNIHCIYTCFTFTIKIMM